MRPARRMSRPPGSPGLVLIASPSTSRDSLDRLRSYAKGDQEEIQTDMGPIEFDPIAPGSLRVLYDRVQTTRKLLQPFQDSSE